MICTVIRTKSVKKLLESFSEAQKKADLTEIWFDEFSKQKLPEIVEQVLSKKKRPIIYKSLSEDNLEIVVQKNIDYIDLDVNVSKKILKKVKKLNPKTKIIISFHDFKKTPSSKELRKIAKKIKAKGADIIKMATMAKSFSDSLRMLSILDELTQKKQKAICICMGKEGEITRITGHLFGNFLMYAPLNEKEKTAKGQLTIDQLKKCHSKLEL